MSYQAFPSVYTTGDAHCFGQETEWIYASTSRAVFNTILSLENTEFMTWCGGIKWFWLPVWEVKDSIALLKVML